MPVLKVKKNGEWVEVLGYVDGYESTKTFLLEDENGNQLTGVVVDEFTVFTAASEDIKLGKVAASDSGIITGTHTCD